MEKFKLFIACLSLIFIAFYTLPVNSVGQDTPPGEEQPRDCDTECTDWCGEPTQNECTYTYCDSGDGGGTYLCYGEYQF